MKRQISNHLAIYLVLLACFCGCKPIQPFYYGEDGDLSHLIEESNRIENPDVDIAVLPDAIESHAPLTLTNPDFEEIWDLSLEEVVSITLHNSQVIRSQGAVQDFGFADGLVNRTGGAATVFDAALSETSTSSAQQPAIASPGNGFTGSSNSRATAAAAGGVESALGAFDTQMSILGSAGDSAIYDLRDRPLNSTGLFGFPTIDDRQSSGLSFNVAKRTAGGANLGARAITNFSEVTNTNQTLQDGFWNQALELQWDQPLLRGRGTQVNRIPIILARINTDITLAGFDASVRNLVLDLENTYWDLHNAYRNLETAKIARDSAQVAWKIAYEKLKAGTETVQAESQAKEQYFFFRSSVETAFRQLLDTENQLRFLMGIAPADGRLIRPIDEPTMARVEFDWFDINAEALARSPELRQQKWTIKQRELELISARNQLLPVLDLGAVYRFFGAGDELISGDRNGLNFPAVGSTAWDELTEGNFQEFSVFFEFRSPVGYRRELAAVRNTQLQLVRAKAHLEDMELNTSHNLARAIRDLDTQYQLAKTHFNRWSAARKEVASVDALYRYGKATLDLVLRAQERRARAQLDYYTALAGISKAIASVHFRKGSLLEFNNVHLAEGAWPKKAYWDAMGRARERDASYYFNYGTSRPSVVSRGPRSVDSEEFEEIIEESTEEIPFGEPTPAESESDLADPPDAGPITELPQGPLLRSASLDERLSEALDTKNELALEDGEGGKAAEPKPFNWVHFRHKAQKLTAPKAAGDDANPLRGVGKLDDMSTE